MNRPHGIFDFGKARPLIEERIPEIVASNGILIHAGSVARVAEVIGVSSRTVQRWQRGQRLSEWAADLVATRLGTHPSLIWDDWFDDLEEVS